MSIAAISSKAEDDLRSLGIASYKIDVLVMLEHVLKKRREWLIAHNEYVPSPREITQFQDFMTQRKSRTPLAYIIGSKEFYGRDFFVNKDVLIPRPESEQIIEYLKKLAATHQINTVMDMGTGSGILAITAKKELPDVHVTAIDISKAALAVARKNARLHQAQLQFKLCDITEGIPKMPATRPYALLVNLPYVPEGLVTSPEITKEPALALFSGKDGMDHYQLLWNQIRQLRHKPLAVITESLQDQHELMRTIAKISGYTETESNQLIQVFALI
jgi:release factor glutamine methyltransferase